MQNSCGCSPKSVIQGPPISVGIVSSLLNVLKDILNHPFLFPPSYVARFNQLFHFCQYFCLSNRPNTWCLTFLLLDSVYWNNTQDLYNGITFSHTDNLSTILRLLGSVELWKPAGSVTNGESSYRTGIISV